MANMMLLNCKYTKREEYSNYQNVLNQPHWYDWVCLHSKRCNV